MARPIIDVGLRIDISDQIASIEKQLNGLANKAGGKMTKEVANQIAALESELKGLQDSFAKLNTSKLSTKTFQAATKEITAQIAELDKRTSALEASMAALVKSMPSDGASIANPFKQVAAEIDSVKKNAQEATKAVGDMVSAFEGSSNVRLSTGQDEGSLKRELKELQELSKTILKIKDDDLYSSYKGSSDDYIKEIDALYSKYNDIMNKMSDEGIDVSAYEALRNELVKVAASFSTLYNSLPEDLFDSISGMKFSGTHFDDIAEIIKEDLSSVQLEVSSRIDAINKSLANIGEGVTVDNVKNKLTVPLDISTSQTTLLKRAKEIIDAVQPYLNNYPLKVQFILQSGYSSKKTNSLLSNLQKEINELPEEVNKSGIQELYDKIAKDFSGELKFKITADALEKTEEKINNTVAEIRKAVEKPMKITPEIVLEDTNVAEVQTQLNKLSKNLTLSIDKLVLSADAKQTAKKSTAAKEVKENNQNIKIANESIDAILSKISEVGGSLAPISKLLLDIRETLQLLPTDVGSIQEPIQEITASVKELTSLLQSSIQVLSGEDLDGMFQRIQRSIEGISGSLRGKNLDKIKEVLAEFKKYRALGGTSSLSDLGGADNAQKWLKKHYLDTPSAKSGGAIPTDNADMSALLERLNEVSEAIIRKTSLFEEERNKVDQYIPEECEKLNLLGDVIGVITNNLTSLNEQFKTRRLTSWSDKFKSAITEVSALLDENFAGKIAEGNALDSFIRQATEARESILSLSDAVKAGNAGAEASGMNELADSSSKASKSKRDFAEANAEVISSIVTALKSIDSEGKAFESLNKIIGKFSGKRGQSNADSTVQALERIRDVLTTPIDEGSMVKVLENIAAQGANLEHLATVLKATRKQVATAKEAVKTGSADPKLTKSLGSYIEDSLKRIDSAEKTRSNQATSYTKEFAEQIENARAQLNQLNKTIKEHPSDTPWDKDEIASIKEMQQSIDGVISGLTDQGNILETTIALDKLSTRISKTLIDNTRMSSDMRLAFVDLRKRIDEARESTDKVSAKRLTAEFQRLNSELEQSERTGKSFWAQISKAITSRSAQFVATYLSFQDIIRYGREVVTTVIQIDSALTELRKVSDASTERLARNFEVSAETAKELGSSITHVINITADWARLGFSVDEAEALARVTTLFQNVGDNMSADDASSFMISTLKGFQMQADEAEHIADVYNEVANNFAIDTAGIGEALQRSAASFNAANTSLEGAISVITTANSVVQNPEAVGTAMKTLSARIRGSKVELEELGEEEEDIINLSSKLRREVEAMTGFDIMEDEDTYKTIDQIIIGIGKHWKELTDIQQAALAEDLAGKRNSNVLIALLQNSELVEEVYEKATHAAGSAAKEQQNYMMSIQYSLDRFKASMQEIEADLVSSQLVKDIVDIGTTIVNFLDVIVEHIGLLGTGASIAGIVALVKNFKELKVTFEAASEIFKASKIGDSVKSLDAITAATGNLTKSQAKLVLSMTGLDAEQKKVILERLGFSGATATATVSTEAFTAALWENVKAMAAALVTNPVGWLILAAAAVAGTVAAFDALTDSVKEVKEKVDEYSDSVEKLRSELEQLRNLEKKTPYDTNRIAYLEKELKIQERLLEVEKQRYYKNLTERTFANSFDPDNIATIQEANASEESEGAGVRGRIENLKELSTILRQLGEEMETLDENSDELAKKDERRQKVISNGDDIYSALLENYQTYLQQEETLKAILAEKTSNGFNMITGKAREDAERELRYAEKKVLDIANVLREYEMRKGEYDPFNAITGIESESAINEIKNAVNSTGDLESAQARLMAQFPSLEALCHKYGLSVAELVEHYWEEKEAIEAVENADAKRANSLSTAVSNMNSRILPQFEELGKAYDEIFNGDNGFDLSGIGTADLEGIRSSFEELDEALEIDWEGKTEDVDKFLSVISNSSSTAQETQEAFNSLATAYFNAAVATDDFTEENAKALEQMLTEMGVVNASDVVESFKERADALDSLSRIKLNDNFAQGLADAIENLDNEFAKLEDPDWGISEENIKKVKDGTIQSAFGNVDMDKRAIITWSEELKKQYKRELDSWQYDPEIGGIDTVFGGSGSFGLKNGGEVEIAYTPIIQTDDGAELVAADALMDYIQSIVDIASEDGNWTLDEILALDRKGIKYDRYDEYGRKIGEQIIKGVIAGAGDNAIEIGSLMHFSGEEGAIALAKEELEAYTSVKKKAEQGTLSLENVTAQEIAVLEKEGVIAVGTAQQIALLALQKQLVNAQSLNTESSCQSLMNLAQIAGFTAAEVEVLNQIMGMFAQADAAEAKGGYTAATVITSEANRLLANFKDEVNKRASQYIDIDFAPPKVTKDAGSGGSKAGKTYVEKFEEELKALEEQRDAGILSEKQFLDKYKALIEKYFKDVDGYGDEYAKRMGDYFQRAISYYESIFSAVGTLLNKRISAAQKGRDAAVQALNDEKDAAAEAYQDQIDHLDDLIEAKEKEIDLIDDEIKGYEDQIDAIEDQIDALEEANQKRQQAINLQKAEYQLQRSLNQKTRLVNYMPRNAVMRF